MLLALVACIGYFRYEHSSSKNCIYFTQGMYGKPSKKHVSEPLFQNNEVRVVIILINSFKGPYIARLQPHVAPSRTYIALHDRIESVEGPYIAL